MTKTLKLPGLLLASAVGLSACQLETPCDIPQPSGQVSGAVWMTDCTDAMSPTPFAQLPTGSATYAGYVTGQFAPAASASSDTLVGDASLTVNFGAGVDAVTGTLSNFNATSGGALGGSLSVNSGAVVNSGGNAAFAATITGTLTGYNGSDTVTFNTAGAGGFLGGAAQGITFITQGTATMGSGYIDNNAGLAVVGLQP